ncbi:MAG: hypothetical protein CMN73_12275 [Sphingomonas sp.]|nr:hypothetical protein [Sphingomonas sp.]|tara:strand:+ start:3429 stop:3779 length:351 start_codon:yes stop_codon:yes gene_type:complete
MSVFLAMTVAMGLAVPQDQPADPNIDDLKCVATLAAALDAAPADQQQLLSLGVIYFMGRIDGRSPGYDFSGQLRGLLDQGSSETETQAEITRCSAILRDRGQAMIALGQEISEDAQ